jgi:DNA ligase-1
MSEKLINKIFTDLIPTFEVALANKYDDYKNKINWNDCWYASTKLDGCRCIVIIDNLKDIKIFSRSGKEFLTLDVLKKEIAKLDVQDIVLDGEICIVDENGKEDFQAILKEYNKKDHTIKNPKLLLFDCIALNDFENKKGNTIFSDRIKLLNNIINKGYNNSVSKNIIEVLSQIKISNNEELQKLRDEASEKGWEGIMIRKDIGYEGKRSNNLLKCKLFQDAEYIVNDIEIGPFRVINNGKEEVEEVMTNVFIEHKGFKVSVGSGFSLEERRRYKENPNDIIGKEITVSYFEETINQQGTISLRFPTIKAIYENNREI